MPSVESERLPKEATGRGLTSTLLPRNLEEETQHEETQRNILRISRARPGRRSARLETRWPGGADVAWDGNLTDLVGLGPVIRKHPPLGRARAGPGAVGPARLDPTSESWPHPKKPLDLKYWIGYIWIGYVTI